MAFNQLTGQGMFWPPWPPLLFGLATGTGLTIDATGEKIALIGRVYFNDRTGTRAIRTVGFRFGTVTKAGGSGLTVSLQTVNAAAGFPIQPDETQDETYAITNANASFATDTWLQTGNLSSDRTVSFGELVAIVIEYDGGGRLGSDSVVVSTLSLLTSMGMGLQSLSVLKTGGTWATVTGAPLCVLEFADGDFGLLTGAFPFSAVSSLAYKSDSAADEAALRFKVPVNCKIDGGWVALQFSANTSDCDIVLYQGTTSLASVSIDANQARSANNDCLQFLFSSEIELTAGVEYFLAVKPTQATSNVRIQFADVADADYLECMPLGTEAHYATRVDAGAWSTTTTRLMMAGVRVSALHSVSPKARYMLGM